MRQLYRRQQAARHGVPEAWVASKAPMSELRAMRLRAGLTQRALSRLSGVSVPAISAIENGKQRPYPFTRKLIHEALEACEPCEA